MPLTLDIDYFEYGMVATDTRESSSQDQNSFVAVISTSELNDKPPVRLLKFCRTNEQWSLHSSLDVQISEETKQGCSENEEISEHNGD